jgi:hypothetical protein
MKRILRYGTHIPILVKIMGITKGPVLEMGCGFSSTPLLYWLCQEQGRKFVSFENDEKWIKKVGYPVTYVKDWDKADIEKAHWSVALLDHRPGERRHLDALRLKDKADFIILHDSEPGMDIYYQYSKIYPSFKYRFDYTKFLPHTVVLSNLTNVQKFLK